MTTPGGKLLNAKDSATLSCSSKEERERLVAQIMANLRRKRMAAERQKRKRASVTLCECA